MATNILAPLPVDFFLKKEVSPFNQTFIVVTEVTGVVIPTIYNAIKSKPKNRLGIDYLLPTANFYLCMLNLQHTVPCLQAFKNYQKKMKWYKQEGKLDSINDFSSVCVSNAMQLHVTIPS